MSSEPVSSSQQPSNRNGRHRSDLRLLLPVGEAAEALGIGRTKVYELISVGELESVHIGRSCRVPVTALQDYIERLRSAECG